MSDFLHQLRQRQTRLAAWQLEAAQAQAGPLAPMLVEGKARALWGLKGEAREEQTAAAAARGMGDGLAVGGRALRLEGQDPFVQRLTHAAAFLAPFLDPPEVEAEAGGGGLWASKPAVGALADLHKRGKELGAPRHELKGVEAALKACHLAGEGAKALLPEGVTKQGHLRLKQAAARCGRVGKKRAFFGDDADEKQPPAAAAAAAAAAAEKGGGGIGLETLLALIAALLDFPYKLERELVACLRLLGAVTRVRRQSWELLGVRTGEDFAALDALLARAHALFSALQPAGGGASVELEGAPRFYPQGIAPSSVSSASALASAAAAAAPSPSSVLGKRRGGGKAAFRMVKGRWEGRRFSFLPGPNVWLGVDRLSEELRVLGVDVPELALLLEKGNLVLSEDVEEEEERERAAGRGKGKGKGKGEEEGKGKKKAKKGWNTALPQLAAPKVVKRPPAAAALAAAAAAATMAAAAAVEGVAAVEAVVVAVPRVTVEVKKAVETAEARGAAGDGSGGGSVSSGHKGKRPKVAV